MLTPPDLISIIDTEKLAGVHNSTLKKGDEVAIVAIPAEKRWRSKEGKKLFNPRAFDFDMEVKLI